MRLRSPASHSRQVMSKRSATAEAEPLGEALPPLARERELHPEEERAPDGSVEYWSERTMLAPASCRNRDTAATIPGRSGQDTSRRIVTCAACDERRKRRGGRGEDGHASTGSRAARSSAASVGLEGVALAGRHDDRVRLLAVRERLHLDAEAGALPDELEHRPVEPVDDRALELARPAVGARTGRSRARTGPARRARPRDGAARASGRSSPPPPSTRARASTPAARGAARRGGGPRSGRPGSTPAPGSPRRSPRGARRPTRPTRSAPRARGRRTPRGRCAGRPARSRTSSASGTPKRSASSAASRGVMLARTSGS